MLDFFSKSYNITGLFDYHGQIRNGLQLLAVINDQVTSACLQFQKLLLTYELFWTKYTEFCL